MMNKKRRIVYSIEDLVLLLCIIVLFIILTVTGFNVFEKTKYRAGFTFISGMMTMIVARTVFTLKKKNEKAEEEWFEIKKNQMEYTLEQNYQKETEALREEYRNMQEERSAFYTDLYSLLEKKKYDEVDALLGSKNNDITEGELFFSGNRVIDVVVSQKNVRALEENIHLKCDIQCLDIKYIREADLNVLLSNMLDNAIEAVIRWKTDSLCDDDKTMIALTIRKQGNFLVIVEDNPCVDVVKGKNKKLLSTKTDAKHHGIGMQSMERIVQRYNGLMDYSLTDGHFRIKIVLEDDING